VDTQTSSDEESEVEVGEEEEESDGEFCDRTKRQYQYPIVRLFVCLFY
jgi:hypothetical protein